MAIFRNLCVNLRNYLCGVQLCTPPRNPLVSLTLRKFAYFYIGNLICAQYRFMDGH